MRVTRSSTRAARATAANPPIAPANPPAPIPVPAPVPAPVVANGPQAGALHGPSPRRTRSGKIIGMVRSVATKLTRPRRAPRAAPTQAAAGEVVGNIAVAPTTNPGATVPVPQPPAPPRKRGGRAAAKKDAKEVQAPANDAVAPSATTGAEPAPPTPAPTQLPAPIEGTIEVTEPTQSLVSKDKGKARELPIEDDQAPPAQPVADVDPVHNADPVPVPVPASPKAQKPAVDTERIIADLHLLNTTVLADDQIDYIEHHWESCVSSNTRLKYLNTLRDAERLVREARAAARGPAPAPAPAPVPAPAPAPTPAPAPAPTPNRATAPATTPNRATGRGGARNGRAGGQPRAQPPVASTSQGAGPSNAGPSNAGPSNAGRSNGAGPSKGAGPSNGVVPSELVPKLSPLKRERAVNWGQPKDYRDTRRQAKAGERSQAQAPADLNRPAANGGQVPVASTSSTAPLPSASTSTSRAPTATAAAPSGNGNGNTLTPSEAGERPFTPSLRRWNAVILGYPEDYTPRNPWPASMIDPTGRSSHPDAVQDASGTFVIPRPRNPNPSASVALPATHAPQRRLAPPQIRAPPPVTPVTAAAPDLRSPPPSASSNESADVDEVEASLSINLDDGDTHPAADLLASAAQPAASTNAPRPSAPAGAHGSIDSARRYDDEDAIVQQVVDDVVREFEAERAARPAPSASALAFPSLNTPLRLPPLPPLTPDLLARVRANPIVWRDHDTPAPKTGSSLLKPLAKNAGAGTGSSIFGGSDLKGKGKGKGKAPTTLFGPPPGRGAQTQTQHQSQTRRRLPPAPQDRKGKKRAREDEPEDEVDEDEDEGETETEAEANAKAKAKAGPVIPIWGYTSSTGPMKVRVELVPMPAPAPVVPAAPSPKRQRVSEPEATDAAPVPAPAPAPADSDSQAAAVSPDARDESAPAPSTEHVALGSAPPRGRDGAAKRSRAEFEEGSSSGGAGLEGGDKDENKDEDEDEARPAKRPRTDSQ